MDHVQWKMEMTTFYQMPIACYISLMYKENSKQDDLCANARAAMQLKL